MKTLCERLRDLANSLEALGDVVVPKSIEDLKLAANILEARDTGAVQPHPLKGGRSFHGFVGCAGATIYFREPRTYYCGLGAG